MTTAPFHLLECRWCHVQWGAIGVVIPQACKHCEREDWIRTPDDQMSNWYDATQMVLEGSLLEGVRDATLEFYVMTGNVPSVAQLRKALTSPGL